MKCRLLQILLRAFSVKFSYLICFCDLKIDGTNCLNLSTLGKISSDDVFEIFFLIFSQKTGFDS